MRILKWAGIVLGVIVVLAIIGALLPADPSTQTPVTTTPIETDVNLKPSTPTISSSDQELFAYIVAAQPRLIRCLDEAQKTAEAGSTFDFDDMLDHYGKATTIYRRISTEWMALPDLSDTSEPAGRCFERQLKHTYGFLGSLNDLVQADSSAQMDAAVQDAGYHMKQLTKATERVYELLPDDYQ